MKKSSILSLIFTLVLLLSVPFVQADAATKFTDVKSGHWSEEQIKRFVESEIITGFEDGTFRPTKQVTREEAAIILTRALKLDTTNVGTVDYKDVNVDRYAYKYIAAVTKADFMSGYNGEFNPTNALTRQDMAVILQKAFTLQADGVVPFTDVTKNYAYDAIRALYSNGLTMGYSINTFKPTNATTREEFVVFLDRGLSQKPPMANYMKEVYANEAALTSYEFEGGMNLGLVLPKSDLPTEDAAELEAMFAMLEDIEVNMTGSYQLDPMLMDVNVSVTLKGEPSITLDMPMIMTEDKMWMKFPETPFMPVPEEMAGKYIELDMAELSALSGQPAPVVNVNLQTKFAVEIQNLFLDYFANGLYSEVSKAGMDFANNTNVDKVVKFELTNESLVPFIDVLLNKFMPEFVELLSTPGYAEALGLTAEDVALMQQSLAEPLGLDLAEISKFVSINKFNQYEAIHKDKYILSSLVNVDVDLTVEEETVGLKMAFDLNKKNVNVPVQITIPDASEVVPFEALFEFDEDMYFDEEFYDEEFELEI